MYICKSYSCILKVRIWAQKWVGGSNLGKKKKISKIQIDHKREGNVASWRKFPTAAIFDRIVNYGPIKMSQSRLRF